MTIAIRPAETRNLFAHAIVGYCNIRPEALIIYRQEEHQRLYRATFAPVLATGEMSDEHAVATEQAMKDCLQTGLAYRRADFLRLMQANDKSADILLKLGTLCSRKTDVTALGARQLRCYPELAGV